MVTNFPYVLPSYVFGKFIHYCSMPPSCLGSWVSNNHWNVIGRFKEALLAGQEMVTQLFTVAAPRAIRK